MRHIGGHEQLVVNDKLDCPFLGKMVFRAPINSVIQFFRSAQFIPVCVIISCIVSSCILHALLSLNQRVNKARDNGQK